MRKVVILSVLMLLSAILSSCSTMPRNTNLKETLIESDVCETESIEYIELTEMPISETSEIYETYEADTTTEQTIHIINAQGEPIYFEVGVFWQYYTKSRLPYWGEEDNFFEIIRSVEYLSVIFENHYNYIGVDDRINDYNLSNNGQSFDLPQKTYNEVYFENKALVAVDFLQNSSF